MVFHPGRKGLEGEEVGGVVEVGTVEEVVAGG